MFVITPTVCGVWLRIRDLPAVFFGSRAGAIAFVDANWTLFLIQPSEPV
jgi:hypothetical protein